MNELVTTIRHRSPGVLLLGLIGCTALLTIGDMCHVRFGVLTYPGPGTYFGQAWWVAPLFMVATIGFVVMAWPFAPHARSPLGRDVVTGALWFFGTYVATAVFGEYELLLTVAILTIWILRVIRRSDRVIVALFSVLLAIGGTLFELGVNYAGLAHYEVHGLLLVPLWLPALYLQGAPLALVMTRWLRGQPT